MQSLRSRSDDQPPFGNLNGQLFEQPAEASEKTDHNNVSKCKANPDIRLDESIELS